MQRASAPVDVSEEATLARLLDLHTKLSDTLAAFRALGPPAGEGWGFQAEGVWFNVLRAGALGLGVWGWGLWVGVWSLGSKV